MRPQYTKIIENCLENLAEVNAPKDEYQEALTSLIDDANLHLEASKDMTDDEEAE